MKILETPLPGVLLLEPKVFEDERGFCRQMYNDEMHADVGTGVNSLQENDFLWLQGGGRVSH